MLDGNLRTWFGKYKLQMNGVATLTWPQHFPPTDSWKKFFYGVRWLGPDISFFKELKQSQASRTQEVMSVWTDEKQKSTVDIFGDSISRQIGWQTPYFLPKDSVAVIAYGPRFLSFDELLWEAATLDFEKKVGRKFDNKFWETIVDWNDKNETFGKLIYALTNKLAEVK
jgi:hypothetical protein